jgi:glucose-6-phosphate 1-dehydrogenase
MEGGCLFFPLDVGTQLGAQIFTPILHWIEGKSGQRPRPVPYPYGSRGPKELDPFIQKYGFKRADAS